MAATLATITGTICKADGTVVAGAQIKATIKSTEDDMGGQVASGVGITSDQIEAFSEDDGTFAIDLVAGATVLLDIPDINLRKEIVVPASGSTDFTELV
jgi:hypothetical protein